jgi:hypothetical protein
MAKRDFFHGVRTVITSSPQNAPVTVSSGIVFAVGAAPVHSIEGGGSVHEAVRARNFSEARQLLGYSEDWGNYDLCEVMQGLFRDYNSSPVVFVNVLNPAVHKRESAPRAYPISDERIALPFAAIRATVSVENYVLDEDYTLTYRDDALVLEVLSDGKIPLGAAELTVGFSTVAPDMITAADVIGGVNLTTRGREGLELIEAVFPKYRILPDLILCPKWSSDLNVANAMAVKSDNYNGIFKARALVDIPTESAPFYEDAAAWKDANGILNPRIVLCWPLVKRGERVYRMSTHMAGLITRVDFANDNVPSESPSNKPLLIGSAVTAGGAEVLLDLQQANFLNENGITTALNFTGWVLWGNYTAAYAPVGGSDDSNEQFLYAARMGDWLSNTVILSHWGRVDAKLDERLIESILDTVNIWFNGLVTAAHLIGGRASFTGGANTLNTVEDFRSGRVTFVLYYAVPGIAQEIVHVLTFDPQYIEDLLVSLGGGA